MNSVSAMVASCGCALITSSKGLTYFASTYALSGFKGTEQPWKRRFTVKSIGLGPYGRSRLLQQKPASVQLSQTFVTKKSAVASQAPNARVRGSKDKQSVASKEKNDRQPDKSRCEVGIEGKNHKQEGKTGMSSPNMLESTSIATRQVVVKDGFAGLSALKAQLEQERPRISRVKENDVGREFLPHHKHRDDLRRRQEADKSPTSPKSDELMTKEASNPSKLTSSNRPIRDGDTTTKAAAGKEVPFLPPSSSSSSSSSSKNELRKVNPRIKKQGGGLRDVWKGQPSSLQTDATELRGAKESSSEKFRTPSGGKLDPNSNNRTTDTEAVQNSTLGVERDTAEMGRSSSNADSLIGLNSQSATKLSGESVLEALKRAAALRDNKLKSRRKVRPGGGKFSSDSDSDDDSKQDPLPPLVFKPEWASKIEELENDLKQLRMLS